MTYHFYLNFDPYPLITNKKAKTIQKKLDELKERDQIIIVILIIVYFGVYIELLCHISYIKKKNNCIQYPFFCC